MRKIILFIFLVSPGITLAQGDILSDTITWSAASDKNLKTGDSFTRDAVFVTYGDSIVKITRGTDVRLFRVTSTEGTWPDISLKGQILFHIVFGTLPGIISISRSTSTVTITIDLTLSLPDGMRNQYFIDLNSVRKL